MRTAPKSMMRLSRFGLIAAAVVAMVAACHSTGVEIPPGWQNLKPCTYKRTIPVSHLADIGKPRCNMAGTAVELPDGQSAEVGSVGATNSWGYLTKTDDAKVRHHFTIVNWGVPGTAVAEYDERGRLHTIWASSKDAADLLRSLD
jgi:hypothetical protein